MKTADEILREKFKKYFPTKDHSDKSWKAFQKMIVYYATIEAMKEYAGQVIDEQLDVAYKHSTVDMDNGFPVISCGSILDCPRVELK